MKPLLLLTCACLSCSPAANREHTVSVSILPQQYLVQRVAGNLVNINVMIPPGANPATHDLTPGQLKKLHNSSIYFAIGHLPFEHTHLYPILQKQKNILLVNHSDGQQLLDGTCGDPHHPVDPHIWMSPARAKQIAATIARTLQQQYPRHQKTLAANLHQLNNEIDSIHREATRVTANTPHKTLLVYHPALAYFAADYGMQQLVIEHDGKEPTPLHLKKTIDTARALGIKTVLIQEQFDQQNARAVAREIGARVITIDPLNPDWKQEMRALLAIIDTPEK
jgi:zinc transport system substrate-binding protein